MIDLLDKGPVIPALYHFQQWGMVRNSSPLKKQTLEQAPGARTRTLRMIIAAWIAIGLTLLISFLAFEPIVAIISSILGLAMIAIAVTDAKHFIVPDALSLPAIPAGLISTYVIARADEQPSVLIEHLAAVVVAGALFSAVRWGYRWMRGREGLGLGDVKLAMAAGAWTGLEGLLQIMLVSSLSAVAFVWAHALLTSQKVTPTSRIAFGVFLAPAIWLVWFAQQIDLSSTVYPSL